MARASAPSPLVTSALGPGRPRLRLSPSAAAPGSSRRGAGGGGRVAAVVGPTRAAPDRRAPPSRAGRRPGDLPERRGREGAGEVPRAPGRRHEGARPADHRAAMLRRQRLSSSAARPAAAMAKAFATVASRSAGRARRARGGGCDGPARRRRGRSPALPPRRGGAEEVGRERDRIAERLPGSRRARRGEQARRAARNAQALRSRRTALETARRPSPA